MFTEIVTGVAPVLINAMEAVLLLVLSKGTRIRLALVIAGEVPTWAGKQAGRW